MTHHDPHHETQHVHEDPHHVEQVVHGGGGYFTGATAWMLAMVLFVVLAIVVIIALFSWAA
jgi:uncharacterized membrane protein